MFNNYLLLVIGFNLSNYATNIPNCYANSDHFDIHHGSHEYDDNNKNMIITRRI